jgi:hypothetical protein
METGINYNVQWLLLYNLYYSYSCKATLMMITKVIKTCWIINVTKHIIHAQLLVLLHKFKYSFNARTWNILNYKTNSHYRHMYIWVVYWVMSDSGMYVTVLPYWEKCVIQLKFLEIVHKRKICWHQPICLQGHPHRKDILPIQVGGRGGTDHLTSYKLKCITPPAMGRLRPEKLAEAPNRKKSS